MRLTNLLMLAGLFFCVIVSYVLMSERQDVVSHLEGMEIGLSTFGDFARNKVAPRLAFSKDGSLICMWDKRAYPGNISDCIPDKWIVFSVKDGDFITASSNQVWQGWFPHIIYTVPSTNKMSDTEELLRNFPFLTPDVKWGSCFTNVTAYTIQDATQLALRAHPPPKYTTYEEYLRVFPVVAMFRLGEEADVLWETKLNGASRNRDVKQLAFLNVPDSAEQRILAVCEDQSGYVLKQETGEILSSFTYGHIETEREARWRMRRFALFGRADPSYYEFSAHVFALDPSLRYLAAARGLFDRRLRIISLTDFSAVHEFYANENPHRPRGGNWKMNNLAFSPSGNYLIAESAHGGRLARGRCITEVIDVKSWQVVQKIDDINTHAVAISPDDTQMAYIQNHVLKIVPFVPLKRPR